MIILLIVDAIQLPTGWLFYVFKNFLFIFIVQDCNIKSNKLIKISKLKNDEIH